MRHGSCGTVSFLFGHIVSKYQISNGFSFILLINTDRCCPSILLINTVAGGPRLASRRRRRAENSNNGLRQRLPDQCALPCLCRPSASIKAPGRTDIVATSPGTSPCGRSVANLTFAVVVPMLKMMLMRKKQLTMMLMSRWDA